MIIKKKPPGFVSFGESIVLSPIAQDRSSIQPQIELAAAVNLFSDQDFHSLNEADKLIEDIDTLFSPLNNNKLVLKKADI